MRKVLDNTGERWIPSVRFPKTYKRRVERAARATRETLNEFMRKAVEQRVEQLLDEKGGR